MPRNAKGAITSAFIENMVRMDKLAADAGLHRDNGTENNDRYAAALLLGRLDRIVEALGGLHYQIERIADKESR